MTEKESSAGTRAARGAWWARWVSFYWHWLFCIKKAPLAFLYFSFPSCGFSTLALSCWHHPDSQEQGCSVNTELASDFLSAKTDWHYQEAHFDALWVCVLLHIKISLLHLWIESVENIISSTSPISIVNYVKYSYLI